MLHEWYRNLCGTPYSREGIAVKSERRTTESWPAYLRVKTWRWVLLLLVVCIVSLGAQCPKAPASDPNKKPHIHRWVGTYDLIPGTLCEAPFPIFRWRCDKCFEWKP